MNLYLVNIGLIVVAALLLILVTVGLQHWRKRHFRKIELRSSREATQWYEEYEAQSPRKVYPTYIHGADGGTYEEATYYATLRGIRSERSQHSIVRVVVFLNVASTIIALIPIGFAIFNLITKQPSKALTFNLAAIATLIVTKGGLFLLTWILLPAAKAIPGAVTGAIIKGVYDDWRKKKQPNG